MNPTIKRLLLWVILFAMVVLFWQAIQDGESQPSEISFSEFLAAVDQGRVERVTLRGEEVRGRFEDGGGFRVIAPDSTDLVEVLHAAGVEIHAELPRGSALLAVLLTWGPVLLIVGVWIFILRHMFFGGRSVRPAWQKEHRHSALRLLTRQLEHRFGDVPDWAGSRLEEAEPEQLERWGLRILDAQRLEDVFDER